MTNLRTVPSFPYIAFAFLVTSLSSVAQVVSLPITVPATPTAVAVDAETGSIYIANSTSPTVTAFNPHTNTSTSISVGSTPSAVGIDPQTARVFVANKGVNSVSVINRATNTVLTTTTVGNNPSAIAVNVATNRVYVANFSSSSVSVLNATTGAAVSTVNVGSGPSALAVNPVTNTIYVTNQTGNSVSVINGATNAVTTTITVGTDPVSVGLNVVTNTIFIANFSSNNVSVINGATNTVAMNVTAGTHPIGIAVNPVSNQVYAANYYSASVTQIDGTSFATSTISVGSGPYGIALNTGTNEIYVANTSGNSLSVINGSTAAVSTVSVGTSPQGLAVNSVDNHLYVADSGSNQLSEIDGSLYPTISIQTGSPANGAATAAFPSVINPATNFTYLFNLMATTQAHTPTCSTCEPSCTDCNPYAIVYYPYGTVSVINGNTGATTATLTLGGAFPIAAAVNPVNNKIYVLNYFSGPASPSNPTGNNSYATGTMTIIDGNTNTVLTTINVGQLPNAIAVNPVTNRVYIADIGSGDPANPYPACTPASDPPPNCLNFGVTPGNIVVVDGTTNALIGSPIPAGIEPGGFAINQVSGRVYAYNFFSDNVTAIDGNTNTFLTTIPVGHEPDGIDVNPRTNRVYVANSNYCAASGYTPGLTVIDGSSNSVLVSNLTLDASTGTPWAVVVNPLTNKVYVSNANESNTLNCSNIYHTPTPLPGTSTISVVNGSTNTVIHNLTGGSGVWVGTDWGVLNPGKNKLYFSNPVSANTTILDGNNDTFATVATPDLYIDPTHPTGPITTCPSANRTAGLCPNEGGLVAVNPATGVAYVGETGCCYNGFFLTIIPESTYEITPLLSSITPVADSHTVQTSPVFVTTNTTPSFTFTGESVYSSYSPYMSSSVTEPPPTALYYAVDTMEGGWTSANITSSSGANPASFAATLPALSVGSHMLYVYSTYGREGSADGGPNGTSSAPEPGNIATAYFVVTP